MHPASNASPLIECLLRGEKVIPGPDGSRQHRLTHPENQVGPVARDLARLPTIAENNTDGMGREAPSIPTRPATGTDSGHLQKKVLLVRLRPGLDGLLNPSRIQE